MNERIGNDGIGEEAAVVRLLTERVWPTLF